MKRLLALHCALFASALLMAAHAPAGTGEWLVYPPVPGLAASDAAAVFRLPLEAGRTETEASFQDSAGHRLCAAFLVTVKTEA